jgi:prolyl oligopeptidase
VLHGHAVPDPYRWLEVVDSAETEAWVAAQTALVDAARAGWDARPHFQDRVAALLGAGAIGVPIWRGERCFFVRREPGAEHAVLLVREPSVDGEHERVLLDPMALDPSGATTLDAWQPSKEGDLLAVQVSRGGTEESELSVLDVASGTTVEGPIDRARYSPVAWFPGGTAYCYVRRVDPALVPPDEGQYHRRVWLHRVGADPASDVELFGAGRDPRSYYGVSVSRDGRWLLVSAAIGTEPRNDLLVAPLDGTEVGPLTPVIVGVDAQTAGWVGRDGRLFLHTDLDAPRGRLCVADPATPEVAAWQTLVPERPDAVLEDVAVVDGPMLDEPGLLVSWTRHAVSELTRHRADGTLLGPVALPGVGTLGGLVERPDGGPVVWTAWTDHATPGRVLALDARTGTLAPWADPPGVVDPPVVHAQQVTVTSADGTPVRLFVYSAGPRPDRPRPTILSGYGGFGISMTPGYSAGVLAWVEAGGVYATALLRGGGEEGEAWHRAGMLGEKQHVFDDFRAAAVGLVEAGWTTPEQLGVSGGSNGGLLVGAALTQFPELLASVVCSAPLLDMVRYESFGLGATWNVEYGSAADPEQLGWLLAYSPYHRVEPGVRYPAVLFTVFEGDTRVDPLHARKMCAALQAATAADHDERPVLLRVERDVGHGARALSRTVALAADTLGFQARQLGLAPNLGLAPDPGSGRSS